MDAHSITPILNVSDMAQSFEWFAQLGWKKCWDWQATPDAPVTFGAVGSGPCEIFMCLDGQGGRGREGADNQGVWLSIWVDNVDEIHARCVAAGIEIPRPPTDEPWGVREMHVRHPDGHVFRISRACAKA
ncbi:MAG: bleomycin resistance family protein [Planctomycetaceae bacterium]|nr:bleomycin resistance family protein [Planctomycetaceae bacterium]